jgi:hypothetical protein
MLYVLSQAHTSFHGDFTVVRGFKNSPRYHLLPGGDSVLPFDCEYYFDELKRPAILIWAGQTRDFEDGWQNAR